MEKVNLIAKKKEKYNAFVTDLEFWYDQINNVWDSSPKDSNDYKLILLSIQEGLVLIENNLKYIKKLSRLDVLRALYILNLAKCVINKDAEALETQLMHR